MKKVYNWSHPQEYVLKDFFFSLKTHNLSLPQLNVNRLHKQETKPPHIIQIFLSQIEEYETHQELWRESIHNLSDQFEFLWQEIQAEEKQCKKKKEEEDEDEEELAKEEEQLLKALEASVSFNETNKEFYVIYFKLCIHLNGLPNI